MIIQPIEPIGIPDDYTYYQSAQNIPASQPVSPGPSVGKKADVGEEQTPYISEDAKRLLKMDQQMGQIEKAVSSVKEKLTTLRRTAMPIIRYRTKDLTRIIPGTCACGRTHRRIERIKGRTDDMMIIKGVNIFPIQIEKKLMEIPGVGNNFVIILEREGYDDYMTVKVEVQNEVFTGDLRPLEDLRKRVIDELRADILITPRVKLVEPGSIPATEGKAIRVIDNRKE